MINAQITRQQTSLFAQKENFDIITYTPPAGWKKDVTENIIQYIITNKENNTWCQIGIIKSTISKGNLEKDFESEWQNLIVNNYKPTDAPQLNEVHETKGWKIKEGTVKFKFNNADALAMLTTISGFDRCASIVATTNSQEYLKDIEALLTSVEFKKMRTTTILPSTGNNIETVPVQLNAGNSFAFSTTNFDDGWSSTVQEDWVQVTKGTTTVLIHYPNKAADEYNSVVLDGLKNAWNILVTPKYSTADNFEFKPVSGWQTIEFAEADAVEKATSKTVHVVLFKINYSNGSGKYLEFITPDKRSFEQEFGAYHQTSYGWEKMENMANYNKFAVATTDLNGKWTNDFSGMLQYVNAYTGANAGADTHASNEVFEFYADNTYQWSLSVASGYVGNIKFQSVKSNGKLSLPNIWQLSLSDIEGKSRTYNVFFSCIKRARILWIDEKAYGKSD
jgi:hypothetical protein